MKNKRGFTLIELLVVIALMLSILAIAIINFVNVSNKKKEESWERVKEQTELAAEEYFGAYKYYLENLNKADDYARVSIGKLVEEDYLNKVTNPLTGKSLNNCDYVEVTLGTSGNDYVYKYTQNNTNSECNANSYVIVSEVGAPKISVDITKGTKNNNYYVTDVDITATIETGGNGAIKSVKHCTSSKECTASNSLTVKTGKKSNYTVTNYSLTNNTSGIDGNKVTTYFVATNTSDKKVIGSVTYKKDTEKPICGTNNGSTTWVKDKRTITQKCTDKTSGCTKDNYVVSFTNTTKLDKIKIEDKAGNVNDCDVNVYVDNTPPTCDKPIGEGSASSWTNKERKITQNCSDEGSGCDSVTKSFTEDATTGTITIKDKVGHETKCPVGVYIDTKKPTCKLSLSGTKGNKVSNLQWYIKDNVTINMSDKQDQKYNNVSSGIKTYGLATNKNSTNKKTSETQKDETSKITWYGYVEDKAGNKGECDISFGLEKSVSITFDSTDTNGSKSYNKKGSSDGKTVFDSNKGACGFGNCSNIKCKTDSSKKTTCPSEYFARSCMYVNTYDRYFYVNAISYGSNQKVKVDGETSTSGMKRIESINRHGGNSILDSNYYYRTVGSSDGGRDTFTAHQYQYTSPAGLKSNKIRLYVEYVADCGYYYY